MFSIGPATRIFLAVGTTDMRKGFEGLFALVQSKLQEDPLSGHVFLFCNRERTRLKALFWDGSGLWICAKRLEKGRFSWPTGNSDKASVALDPEQFALLLGGLDLSSVKKKAWWRKNAYIDKV